MRYGSDFIRKLPGCVKKNVAWRAAPSPGARFEAYDLVLCNFPSILESYRRAGWRAAYFTPAHDPEMDVHAANTDRPIDVIFVGSYSRHHTRRATLLDLVARERASHRVCLHLEVSRMTAWAESPLGCWLLPQRLRRPPTVQGRAPFPGSTGSISTDSSRRRKSSST